MPSSVPGIRASSGFIHFGFLNKGTHMSKHFALALGLSAVLGALCLPAVAQDNSNNVVAEIGGQPVTTDELLEKEAGKLLQARYKYYLAERDALQEYIDNQLLEMQAKKENVSVEELLKRHVSVTVQEPTEDQLKVFYEGVQTDESYESARPKILDTLHQLRMNKAKEAYIASLRADYGVVVELNQPTGHVDVGNDPRLGPDKAPIQVVEFADYECPYCQKVAQDLIRLREQFGNQVSVVYKDYPLPMHPLAARAAEAARCAGEQGKFWEFHDALFESKRLQVSDLKQEARTLKLDGDKFDRCLDSGAEAAVVKKDLQEGQRLGLVGTPSFFVNGHFMSGAIGFTKLRDTVLQELTALNTAKKQNAALISPSTEVGNK
jgi:protein-disulfide isomerase